MKRRWLYGGIAAVVIVASVFAFGATRVWSESAAHGRYVAAQEGAHSALAAARRDGLTATELSASSRAVSRLDQAQAPDTLPVFGSARSDFYSRESHGYLVAKHQIRARVRRVTRATRSASASTLKSLRADIIAAQSLRLDVSAATGALTTGTQLQSSARTPRQFRAISSRISSADMALRTSIHTRQAAVNSLLAQVHQSLPALQAVAQQSVTNEAPALSLLSLVTARGRADQASLDHKLSAVTAQTSLSSAAVRVLELNDDITAAKKDVDSLLPAKMIVVSTEAQSATAYQAGTQVFSTPVTTGGPELPTDHGVFHIYMKAPNFTFHSPWPVGNPYYYPPSFVQYWMPFDGGEGLHDASWRSNFGPGSNLQPTNLGTGYYILGTHGCVNLPTAAAAWVWNWAPVGTTVVVT